MLTGDQVSVAVADIGTGVPAWTAAGIESVAIAGAVASSTASATWLASEGQTTSASPPAVISTSGRSNPDWLGLEITAAGMKPPPARREAALTLNLAFQTTVASPAGSAAMVGSVPTLVGPDSVAGDDQLPLMSEVAAALTGKAPASSLRQVATPNPVPSTAICGTSTLLPASVMNMAGSLIPERSPPEVRSAMTSLAPSWLQAIIRWPLAPISIWGSPLATGVVEVGPKLALSRKGAFQVPADPWERREVLTSITGSPPYSLRCSRQIAWA